MNRRRFIKRASGLLVPALAAGIAPAIIPARSIAQGVGRLQRSNFIPTPVTSGTIVDVLVRCESGSNGNALTTSLLNAATLGTGGTWSLSTGSPAQPTISTAQEASIPGLMLSDGSGLGESGSTRSWEHDTAGGNSDYPIYTLSPTKSLITVGFALKLTGWSINFGSYNLVRLTASGGDYLICNFGAGTEDDNSFLSVQCHTPSDLGAYIVLQNNIWYSIILRWNQTGTATLKVWNIDAGYTSVGTSTNELTPGLSAQTIRCSMNDDHGEPSGGKFYFDDFAMKFADTDLLPVPA